MKGKAAFSRRLILLMFLSFTAAVVFIFSGGNVPAQPTLKFAVSIVSTGVGGDEHEANGQDDDAPGFSSHQVGCIIPSIDPDPSWIPQYFQPVSCASHSPDVVVVSNGSISISLPDGHCTYAEVVLATDFSTKVDPKTKPLRLGKSPCPADAFIVNCTDGLGELAVKSVLYRCIRRKEEITRRVTSSTVPPPDAIFSERLNILMFGLDSISRVAWLEQMSKTTEYMTDALEAVTFEGYNIVGDGTTAAILGIASGFQEEELHESRRGFKGATQVDDFPLIWRQLADEAGYTTLWDEDGAAFGTFHYRLTGFKRPPVDYYGRLFQLHMEKVYPADACIGSLSTFEEMARQFRELFYSYPDPVRKFGLVFNSHYSHTSSGAGGQEAYRVDSLLRDEIKWLADNGHLNTSVLILFADHGSRFDGSRATHRGKISERLPYLTMAFPSWFRKKYSSYMSNLKTSAKRLTTPFDLHATLLDIGGVKPRPKTPPRGLSFFKPIPLDRTCKDAGISAHWCTCLSKDAESELPLDSDLVKRSLAEFELYVNKNLLKTFVDNGECSALQASRPFAAKSLYLNKEVATFVRTVDGHGRKPQFDSRVKVTEDYIQVSFWTQPGDGQWEVTLAHNVTSGAISILPKQISRTNRYGSAPKCVQDRFPHLRQFCYCKQQ